MVEFVLPPAKVKRIKRDIFGDAKSVCMIRETTGCGDVGCKRPCVEIQGETWGRLNSEVRKMAWMDGLDSHSVSNELNSQLIPRKLSCTTLACPVGSDEDTETVTVL